MSVNAIRMFWTPGGMDMCLLRSDAEPLWSNRSSWSRAHFRTSSGLAIVMLLVTILPPSLLIEVPKPEFDLSSINSRLWKFAQQILPASVFGIVRSCIGHSPSFLRLSANLILNFRHECGWELFKSSFDIFCMLTRAWTKFTFPNAASGRWRLTGSHKWVTPIPCSSWCLSINALNLRVTRECGLLKVQLGREMRSFTRIVRMCGDPDTCSLLSISLILLSSICDYKLGHFINTFEKLSPPNRGSETFFHDYPRGNSLKS